MQNKSIINEDRLRINSDTRLLGMVRNFISKNLKKSLMPKNIQNRIILAVDEAVTNIIEHAYEFHKHGVIDIAVNYDNEKFKITIYDSGKTFNPNNVAEPNIMEHIKKKKKKGLGIFLIRQIMDEIHYDYKEGYQNELMMIKYIPKEK